MSKYPEYEKMKAIQKESQSIGEFLAWLETKEIMLTKWDEKRDFYFSILRSSESLLAEYFDIDLDKVEKEQREILDEARKLI